MEFYISSATDVGIKKEINQDCVFSTRLEPPHGPVAFAALCDGMGGLQFGEVASASVIDAFSRWAAMILPQMAQGSIEDGEIRRQWTNLVVDRNAAIRAFGERNGCKVGTTAVAILLTQDRYYLLNVGDSRAYELGEGIRRITVDHTVVEQEVQLGNLTLEQAESAPMHNVLTRCIGVMESVYPDFYFGTPRSGEVYMLCSDGFRHRLSQEEIRSTLMAGAGDPERMTQLCRSLIELCKQRGETDNISAIAIAAV